MSNERVDLYGCNKSEGLSVEVLSLILLSCLVQEDDHDI